jgi:hypothetical protein
MMRLAIDHNFATNKHYHFKDLLLIDLCSQGSRFAFMSSVCVLDGTPVCMQFLDAKPHLQDFAVASVQSRGKGWGGMSVSYINNRTNQLGHGLNHVLIVRTIVHIIACTM